MDFLNSSDGIINGALSNAWSMTLGASNTLKFVNFEPGATFTLRLLQDGTGNRTVNWPSTVTFQAGQAPSLQTAASAADVFSFVNTGTLNSPTFSDTGGGSNRLPGRLAAAGLATVLLIGVASVLRSSNGNGARVGTAGLSDIYQFQTGTGANQETVAKISASGSFIAGQSGALVIGSPILSATGAKATFFVSPAGKVTAKSTVSGAGLNVNGTNPQGVLCHQTGGTIGACSTAINAAGKCTCGAL